MAKSSDGMQADAAGRMKRCFMWARVMHDAALQTLGLQTMRESLMATGRGCDTEFSGGAAALEAASGMVHAAFREGGQVRAALSPLSACATQLNCCLSVLLLPHVILQ